MCECVSVENVCVCIQCYVCDLCGCLCAHVCAYVLCVHAFVYMYKHMCVTVFPSLFMFVWLRVTVLQTRSCDPNPVTENPDSCLQSDDTSGDSKTDPRADLEIQTGSCSIDLMAIQTQNRIISFEYFNLFLF